jgi:hypothetical protein
MAVAFAASSLWLERPLAGRTIEAVVVIGLAAALAAAIALLADRRLRRRAATARFAAAFILLLGGTSGLSAAIVGAQMAFAFHPLGEVPLHIAILIVALMGATALYYFLAIAAWLLMPLGLPLTLVISLLIARTRH